MATALANTAALIVDDNPDIVDFLEVYLLQLGIRRVHSAQNAQEAFYLLSQHKINLIFLDISLEGLNGIDIILKLDSLNYEGALAILSAQPSRILRAIRKIIDDKPLHLVGIYSKSSFNKLKIRRAIEQFFSQTPKSPNVTLPQAAYTKADVLQAIKNNEFVNYVMPIVDLATGHFHSVEILTRWQHPDDGMIYPAEFMGILSKNEGLAMAFNAHVLRQGLQTLKAIWPVFPHIHIAVNVSPVCFKNPDFSKEIIAVAKEEGVIAEQITLEITEEKTIFGTGILESLTQLNLAGFNIALDDYGVGHSNLSQLYHGPFNEIKLDMQFTQLMKVDEFAKHLVSIISIIGMEFGMKLVAEGIEDVQMWHDVKTHGYHYAQGYFISPPILPNQLQEWHDSWLTRYAALASTDEADE